MYADCLLISIRIGALLMGPEYQTKINNQAIYVYAKNKNLKTPHILVN